MKFLLNVKVAVQIEMKENEEHCNSYHMYLGYDCSRLVCHFNIRCVMCTHLHTWPHCGIIIFVAGMYICNTFTPQIKGIPEDT